MAKKKELCKDKRGLYQRNLGWKQTDKGYAQQKFYLGRDETKARIASLKLEQLWDAVCARWEASNPPRSRRKSDVNSQYVATMAVDQVTGRESLATGVAAVMSIGVGEIEPVRDGRPVWDTVSFTIAEAIRNGDAIVRVPVPQQLGQFGLESPSVGHWLDQLRRDVPFIHIELHDPEAHQEAEAQIHQEGTRLIDQGRRMVRQGGGGETLHEALTGYTASLQNKHRDLDGTVNPTGTTQVRQVEFLKETLPDWRGADCLDARNQHSLIVFMNWSKWCINIIITTAYHRVINITKV